MGVSISAMTISKKKKSKDEYRLFCHPGFERSLKKSEITYTGPSDTYLFSMSTSYSYYNGLREIISKYFLNKNYHDIVHFCEENPKVKYPNPLYYILNFADDVGYIGPSAVKEMSKYLTPKVVNEALLKMEKGKIEEREIKYICEIIKVIHKAAKYRDGYICFS